VHVLYLHLRLCFGFFCYTWSLFKSDSEAEAEAALDGAAQVEELRKQLDLVSAALHASQSSHHQEVNQLTLNKDEGVLVCLLRALP